MSIDNRSRDVTLRHKAEELMKKRKLASALPLSEEAMLKLIQELEVHQIELELQNEELSLLNKQADSLANEKYAELYKVALQENNSRLELAMQGANMAWWEMDVTTGSVIFGKRKAEMLGYSTGKFKHYTDFTALLHPEDYEKAMNAMRGHMEGLIDKYEVEYRILTHSGDYKWFYDIGSIVKRDLNGNPLNITGIVIDISGRKQAEETLRNSESRLRALLTTIPDLIWLKDINGVYLGCNTMFERFFGFREAQIVGKTDFDFVDQELAGFFRANDLNAMAAGKPTSNDEWITFADDGHRAFLETIKAPMYDAQNKLIGVLGIGRDITERRIADDALLESEVKYRAFFENSMDAIMLTNSYGNTISVNDAACKMFGYTEEELIKLGRSGVEDATDSRLSVFLAERHLNGKTLGEVSFVRKDGTRFPAEISSAVFRHHDGADHASMIIRDITNRKKAENELKQKNTFIQTILDNLPIGISLNKIDLGSAFYANKKFEEIYGWPVGEMKDIVGFFEKVYPDRTYREEILKRVTTDIQLGDISRMHWEDCIVTHKDGSKHIINAVNIPLFEQNTMVSTVIDITEGKRAENEIVILAQSLKSVNECVSITDLDNKIIFVNESFLKTYGYDINELIGENINIVSSSDNPPEKVNEILKATIRGEWQGELLNKRKDGSEFPIFLSTTIIEDKDNKVLGLIGVATNITDRKKTEKELIEAKNKAEESDRLKSAFLANMSHEIRTPMNGILGFAELLKEPMLTGEEQLEYIGIIERSGIRMLNIINDIVDISKVESGQMEVSIKETNINEQIEYLYTFFKPEAHQKGIQFRYKNSLPSKEAILRTDREKLYAILTNLVKNAIKFTHVGAIEFGYNLNVGREPAELEFFVKDTGAGISKEHQAFIFERFRQGNESLNRNYEGAGLGLTISKAYVEMLGGRIWVESDPDGKSGEKGSIFYFTIPYNIESKEKKVDSIGGSVHPEECLIHSNGSGLKILIVEDDVISEKLIKATVKMFSKEVLKAGTGVEGVEACRNNPDIDLVLMDIKMPEMDGLEATRQIRQFNKEVIIIAQTAFALTGDREKAIGAGCNDYIAKPIKKAELMVLIQKYF